MNLVSDDAKGSPETPDQLRDRLMRCPRVRRALVKVARSQGVPDDEREDVVQETLLRISRQTLPTNEEKRARKYINGTGKNVAIDHMRAKDDASVESLEGMGNKAPPVDPRLEKRVFLQGLFDRAAAKFGKKWDWYVAHKLHRKTSKEIGAEHGVTDSHVRDELSVIDRWFAAAYEKRGGVAGLLGLAIAVGLGYWMTHRPADLSNWSTQHETRARAVQVLDAPALRERGTKRCDEGAWLACMHDLEAARQLDPQGQSPELQTLEDLARSKLTRLDARESPEMNAKPGQ
jgi:DNA-directed RNA polymerase specialized sigma24 family protein